jgi:hypothetical protein
MKRWLAGSMLFGLLAPLVVRLLILEHVRPSGMVVVSVWPTSLVLVTGAFGISGRMLYAFSVLLNVALFGAMGWVGWLVSRRCSRVKQAYMGDNS